MTTTTPSLFTKIPSTALLTKEQVEQAVPPTLRSTITQQIVDNINNASADPIAAEAIRDNFISYTAVLKEGRFKTEDYINAVTYVSFKLMNNNNEEAYAKTFPQRYAQLKAAGRSAKDIASYVSMYNKGKLVNLILEQSLVPSWVLNQDLYQKAINVQADLMQNSMSDKVRQEAANSLLVHLKKPEAAAQINIGVVENSGMKELREMLTQVAENQKQAIEDGKMKTIDVASSKLPIVDQ